MLAHPKVSIILPTYNRADFLPDAFASITSQSFTDWELIVVDDGSTDETRQLVEQFGCTVSQKVHYILQENGGAYAARNTGLDHASCEYIAFFDSDDLWLAHHLAHCVDILDRSGDVDWIYGALRRIDAVNGETVDVSNQFHEGKPRPALKLLAEPRGKAFIITDWRMIGCAVTHGVAGGLQTAVIRRRVFESYRFDEQYRNGQDRFAVINAMLRGFGFAYLQNVHLIYRVHQSNDSLSGKVNRLDKQIRIERELIAQYERLLGDERLSRRERAAVRKKLLQEYFWTLGYGVLWASGCQWDAIRELRVGLRHWPWSIACWKTYLLCRLRTFGQPGKIRHNDAPIRRGLKNDAPREIS